MQKNNIKLFVIIGSIILCCFFSTIAYSALYSTMEISGMAYARPVKDVRITDFRLSSSNNATSQYEEFGVNSISMKYNFSEEPSSIFYDVEVTNYGNVDVGLFDLKDAIDNYPNVRCDIYNQIPGEKICDDNGKCNNMAVKTFQIGCSGLPGEYEQTITFDFREYHSVTYTGITNNNYPTEVMDGAELNVDFTEPLKRIAVYQNGEKVAYYPTVYQGSNLLLASVKGNIEIKQEEPVARLVSGKIDEVGSEVCIKDECFYIISNDGSTVSMLAKYNLYVGGKYENNTWTAYGDEATGKQDSTMGAANSIFYGVTAFSENSSDYSGSIVEGYVNNYHNYLKTQGVTPKKSRLITYDEVIKLGCIEGSVQACANAVSFIKESSSGFWTETVGVSNQVYFVGPPSFFMSITYSSNSINGVRPVIELSVDDIFDPYAVGAEKCFGDECFYVISSTDDTVTMLAKYNLHVGNSVDENRNVTPLVSPTGIQDKTAAGSILDGYSGPKYPVIGTVAFSNEYYWEDIDIYSYVPPVYVYNANSSVYTYVNNYKLYLETFGLVVDEARLIKYNELLGLGCSDWNCKNAPNWLYSTSYWTGEAYDDMGRLLVVYKCGESQHIIDFLYNIIDSVGVRPVITISKDYF